MSFKFEVMIQSLQVASQYIGTTLFMAITAIIIGVILGLGIALIRLYRIKGLSQFFPSGCHFVERHSDGIDYSRTRFT